MAMGLVGKWRSLHTFGRVISKSIILKTSSCSTNPWRLGMKSRKSSSFEGNSFSRDLIEGISSRINVIVDLEEARKACDKIVELGNPIGVDMEGVGEESLGLGMIQVLTSEGQIYLIRTGINPDLLHKSGMKEILEDSKILKVMHASSNDMLAIYRQGVRMWGLFDTCVAHRLLKYQTLGESLMSLSISYNDCCEYYGVKANPLKNVVSGSLWLKQKAFYEPKDLEENFILYSAYDVESLLQLHEAQTSLIEPDFQPLLCELTELEIIRAIDPKLTSAKLKAKARLCDNNLFLYNLPPNVRKAHIYEAVADINCNKWVFFSQAFSTAHVTLSSRHTAIEAYDTLTKKLPQIFGPKTEVEFVSELKPKEIEQNLKKHKKFINKLREDNYIVDHKISAQLVDKLISTQSPVSCDFHILENNDPSLELFAGRYPTFKIHLTVDNLTKGRLGDLLSSDRVTKIVSRIDTSNVSVGLKLLSQLGHKANNFFEINTAHKMFDYLWYGQSIYMAPAATQKEIMRQFGLFSTFKLENLLYLYFHVSKQMPAELLEFLRTKSQIELDIGSQTLTSETKGARKHLRSEMEKNSLHVVCDSGSCGSLKEVLNNFMIQNKIEYKRIVSTEKYAIVTFYDGHHRSNSLQSLQMYETDGMVLNASAIETKLVLDKKPLPLVDEKSAEKEVRGIAEKLEKCDFYDLIGVSQ